MALQGGGMIRAPSAATEDDDNQQIFWPIDESSTRIDDASVDDSPPSRSVTVKLLEEREKEGGRGGRAAVPTPHLIHHEARIPVRIFDSLHKMSAVPGPSMEGGSQGTTATRNGGASNGVADTSQRSSHPNRNEKEEGNKGKAKKRTIRKWRLHPGNNVFCCDGLIMVSKQSGVFVLTILLLVATLATFFVFDAPYLFVQVSPALPIIEAILALVMFANLFKTTFSDPGILPRATSEEAADEQRRIVEKLAAMENGETPSFPPSNRANQLRSIQVTINGVAMRLKKCTTCQLYRPPRCSHCSICNNCILAFDHHCPWVGNCVGLRNYRHFYFFLISLCILILFTFGCSSAHLAMLTREKPFTDALKETPASIVVAAVCFFSFFSITCLSSFHTYLMATNLTTNEDIKGTFSKRRRPPTSNPYHLGSALKNCCSRLCGPDLPSLLDSRGMVREVNAIELAAALEAASASRSAAPSNHSRSHTSTMSSTTATGISAYASTASDERIIAPA